MPIGAEDDFEAIVDLVEMVYWTFGGEKGETPIQGEIPADKLEAAQAARDALVEAIGNVDDQIAISYLEGHEVNAHELKAAIRRTTLASLITPVLAGAALRNKGVQRLLDAVVDYLPSPVDVPPVSGINPRDGGEIELGPDDDGPLAAVVFKIVTDPYVGRLAYLRVYSGSMAAGQNVYNATKHERERVGRLLQMHANDREEVEEVHAGGILAAVGLKNSFTGDTLCIQDQPVLLESISFPEPVISVALEPKSKADQDKMGSALQKMGEEDPTFHWTFNEDTGQTIISGMGELHLDVIVDRMLREHSVAANVGRPQVSYREAIRTAARAEGRFVRQSGGRGQYGVVEVEVEPLERGQGYVFEDKTVGGSVPKEYVNSVDRGCKEALESGILAGYPVLDVKVSLVDGSSHAVDSSEMAFKNAGSLGVRAAVLKAQPVLLEPIMKVEVRGPEEFFGAVVGDINGRRGVIAGTDTMGKTQIVHASIPLSETFGYETELRSLSQGRSTSSMEFDRYEEVPKSIADTLMKKSGD